MEEISINEIAKTMTRKEFLNCLDKEGWLVLPKKFNIESINCPSIFNLKTIPTEEEYTDIQICTRCWTKAIKDIKFKDDLEKENGGIRLYYGDEILKMVRENKIIKGQEFYIYYNNVKQIGITVKWNGENFISSDNIKLDVIKLLHFQFQFIKKEYMTFNEAKKLDTPRHKIYGYQYGKLCAHDFVEEMDKKVWEVEK